MENVVLIVCPQGFAPLISERHTPPPPNASGAWCVSPFYSAFPGLLALRFELFVDLFDEVITRADWEGEENKRKSGKHDAGPMRQVLIYPMAIWISFLFPRERLLNYFQVTFMKHKATVAPWESCSSFQHYYDSL